jgi:uncharacterized membrane protein
MSLYTFYTTFLGGGKQLMAVFFLALFAMLMIDKGIVSRSQRALLAIFGIALMVSHYSTAFLLVILVLAALVLLYILRRRSSVLTISLAVILMAVTFSWYMFNANGVVLKQFVGMGKMSVAVEAPGALLPGAEVPGAEVVGPGVESYRLIAQGSVNLPDTLRYLYLVTQFLIVAGVIGVVWRWFKRKERRISDEYMVFSLLFLGLLALELILPKLSSVIVLDRTYVISLFFLAPFCIIGGEVVLKTVTTGLSPGFWKARFKGRQKPASITLSTGLKESPLALKILAVFFAIFLLFNTGFIYELAGHPLATSIALSRDKVDFPVYNSQEFTGGEWLVNNIPAAKSDSIYYDNKGLHLFAQLDVFNEEITGQTVGQILYRSQDSIYRVVTRVPAYSYIYLRAFNIQEQRIALGWPYYQTMDVRQVRLDSLGSFSTTLAESNIIYNNGGCQVLYTLSPYSPP